MTDSNMLKSAVESLGLKYKFIAESLGITPYGLKKKIDNKTEFKASEISELRKILSLSSKEMDLIFFANKSDLKSTK